MSRLGMNDLRERLSALAEEVTVPPSPVTGVHARARGLRRRRVGAALATAAAVTAVTVLSAGWVHGLSGDRRVLPATPPDGPFLGWELDGDPSATDLVAAAERAWSQSSSRGGANPHRDVRALSVRRDTVLGPVVILQGRDAAGAPRLAVLTGSGRAPGQDLLVLRADRPAPDPVATKAINLVTARVAAEAGAVPAEPTVFALTLAAPGVDNIELSSPAVDQNWSAGNGPDSGRFRLKLTAPTVAGWNTTVRLYADGAQVAKSLATEGAAIGDAVAVPATVTTRDRDSLTVSIPPNARIAAGQQVVAPGGLIGRVATVQGSTATVELVTARGFQSPAFTNISDHKGTLAGTGTGLRLQGLPPGAEIDEGNRIMVAGPGAGPGGVGAVTAGFARARLGAASNSVDIRPAVDTDEIGRAVHILVAPVG